MKHLQKLLFDCGGCVGFSKAHYVGERISISEGFLKGREGDIVRVNRKDNQQKSE